MIQKMKKLIFLVTSKEYDKFITDIRNLGVLHIDDLQNGATTPELQASIDLAQRYKSALTALDYAVGAYETDKSYQPEAASVEKGHQMMELIEDKVAEENSVRHAIDDAVAAIDKLEPWGEFQWSTIHQLASQGQKMFFFSCPNKLFKQEWSEKYFATPINEVNKKIYFVAFADELPDITAESLELPAESLSSYTKKKNELELQLKEIHDDLLRINTVYRDSILSAQLANENDIQLSRVQLSSESIAGDAVKLMQGWCLAEKEQSVVEYLDKNKIFYEISDPDFEDNVPIQIKNDAFSSLFEPILRMYSLPNYHDIDPLPLFAPFFMLFFGLCMGDAGYGLLIAGAGIGIMSAKPALKKYGMLGLLLGIMTIICGSITGTFFGIDLATVDWEWIKPIQPFFVNDSMKEHFFGYSPMMVISVIIGLVQVLIGMTMAGMKAVKNYGFIYGVGKFSWVSALLSAVILFGLPMFGVELPIAVQYVLYALIAVSAVGIYFLNNPAAYKKNAVLAPLSNLGGGLWATYGMSTGLLGDLLSYIRLFALGLTGGVLGSVFNTLAMDMSPQIPVVHELVMLIILLLGHGINFGLCMISSFVHPMRLTFVEYFKNAEFDGGGKEFMPFKIKTNK